MNPEAEGLHTRRAALRVLAEVREGRPFDSALDRALQGLSEPDRRLAHELAAGILRCRTDLDARLAPLAQHGWKRVSPSLQDVLRLGAYQLTALDRVPPHAAVHTAVALARQAGGTRAAGFVNALLRRLHARPLSNMQAERAELEPVHRLAADFSHPEWLIRRWVERFGPAATERLARWDNTLPLLVLQPARAPIEALRSRWETAGIPVGLARYGAGLVTDRRHPTELPGFAEGDFIVQDPAQALVTRFADVPPGAALYDGCAAPGGKSIALGRCAAQVVAADVSRRRVQRLADNLRRAGSGREHPVVADIEHSPVRTADVVLLDVPCLGTGTLARHPDARWRVTPEALATLAQRQGRLLRGGARTVKPGGLLIYATCSLESEENEQQVDRFLAQHPEFGREPSGTVPPLLLSPRGDLMILPHQHGIDGAFAARLRRAA